jgi:hypothetical protein
MNEGDGHCSFAHRGCAALYRTVPLIAGRKHEARMPRPNHGFPKSLRLRLGSCMRIPGCGHSRSRMFRIYRSKRSSERDSYLGRKSLPILRPTVPVGVVRSTSKVVHTTVTTSQGPPIHSFGMAAHAHDELLQAKSLSSIPIRRPTHSR